MIKNQLIKSLGVFVFALVVLPLSVIAGCVGIDSINLNPTVVRIAVGQSVLGYVDAAESVAGKVERRDQLERVLRSTLKYIDSDARVEPHDVVKRFAVLVDWDSLPLADRALAVEGIGLIERAIESRIKAGELPADTVLFVRGIVLAALDYLKFI